MTDYAVIPTIEQFQGQYRFLSNFWPQPIWYQGQLYPTNEHAYQAAKSSDLQTRRWIADAGTPGEAKQRGRSVALDRHWDVFTRYSIMEELIAIKFQSTTQTGQQLMNTGATVLVEGNHWHDNTWGICYCARCGGHGHNVLGWLLMRRRNQLISGAT